MCGIVGCGGSLLSEIDLETFEQLIHADVVRGHHATGVFRGISSGGAALFKKALPSPEYLNLPGWQLLRGERLTVYQENLLKTKGEFVPLGVSNYYVGHNRFATRGASDQDENAHPFREGNVTLVHNGSLTGQHRLPDHGNFAVDSRNIAHSIEVQGIDETIQNLQGAFTLVWHDARDNTLNFVRNSQRPLYMVRLSTGAWFWASEKDMLLWILNRRRIKPTIMEEFELEPGVHMKFDVSGGKFTRLGDVKHTFPSFYVQPQTSSYPRSQWNEYDDEYERWWEGRAAGQEKEQKVVPFRTPQSKNLAERNALLAKYNLGVVFGERIELYPFDFTVYGGEGNPTNLGTMSCTSYSEDTGDFFTAVAYGIKEEDFHSMPPTMYGNIINTKEITLPGPAGIKDIEVAIGNLSTEKMVPVVCLPDKSDKPSGKSVGETVVTNCETAGFPLGWAGVVVHVEKDFLTVVFPGYSLDDSEEVTVDIHVDHVDPFSYKEAKEEKTPPTSVAPTAGKSVHELVVMAMLSACEKHQAGEKKEVIEGEVEDVTFHDVTLMDGKRITKKAWEISEDGSCCVCSARIPYSEAETTSRISGASVCESCVDKVNNN